MKHVAGKRGTQNCRFSDVPLDEWKSGSPSAWTFNLRPSSLIEFGFEQKFMTEVSDFPSASSNNWLTLVCLYKAQRRCSQRVFQCHPVIISFWESRDPKNYSHRDRRKTGEYVASKIIKFLPASRPTFQMSRRIIFLSAHWMWCTAVAVLYSHRLHDSFTNTIINQLTLNITECYVTHLPYLSPCNGN